MSKTTEQWTSNIELGKGSEGQRHRNHKTVLSVGGEWGTFIKISIH